MKLGVFDVGSDICDRSILMPSKSTVVSVIEPDLEFELSASRGLCEVEIDEFIELLQLVKRRVRRLRIVGFDPIAMGA